MCEYNDEILLYAYGEPTSKPAAELKKHLKQCPQCRALLFTQKTLETNIKYSYPKPSDINAIRSRVIKKQFNVLPRFFTFVPIRYAMSCAIVLFAMLLVYHTGGGYSPYGEGLASIFAETESDETEIDTLLNDIDTIAEEHFADKYISVVEPE